MSLGAPPAETLDAAEAWGPETARLAGEIVRAYVAESFGALPLSGSEAARLVAKLRDVREAIHARKAA
jgi:hypothetical protein